MSAKLHRMALGALGALAVTAGAAGAQAQTGLTGLWLLDQQVYDKQTEGSAEVTFRPQLKPEFVAQVDAATKALRDGGKVLSDNNKLCLPIGMPGMVTNEFAMKFIESPGEVTVISENSPLTRTVYLDGRKHPDDYDPTWNGHSIGKWDGKTLVVDTVGLNDRTGHIAAVRSVRSLTTHIVERYHLENGGQSLVNVMTFEDPNVLQKPWVVTYRYHRAEKGSELWEYPCEVNAEGWSERFAGDPEFKGPKPAAN